MIDPEMDTVLGSTGARLLPYMLAFWFPQGPRYIKQMSPAFSFHGLFMESSNRDRGVKSCPPSPYCHVKSCFPSPQCPVNCSDRKHRKKTIYSHFQSIHLQVCVCVCVCAHVCVCACVYMCMCECVWQCPCMSLSGECVHLNITNNTKPP